MEFSAKLLTEIMEDDESLFFIECPKCLTRLISIESQPKKIIVVVVVVIGVVIVVVYVVVIVLLVVDPRNKPLKFG